MAVTPRDLPALKYLARYFLMSTGQIKRLCYPDDVAGRITRRRLQKLQADQYVCKPNIESVNPKRGGSTPVWHLGAKGREELSMALHDDSYLLKPIAAPKPLHPYHAILVTDVYAMIDAAIAKQDRVVLEASFNEHEVVNAAESNPKKHFKLFTEIQHQNPRIVCVPDLAILIRDGIHVGAFYLEIETGSNGPRWFASRKYRGYDGLAKRQLHRRHFPSVTVETPFVLTVCPNSDYRDGLIRQFQKKDGREHWRFASISELTEDTFLHGKIWHRVDSDAPGPLVKA